MFHKFRNIVDQPPPNNIVKCTIDISRLVHMHLNEVAGQCEDDDGTRGGGAGAGSDGGDALQCIAIIGQ